MKCAIAAGAALFVLALYAPPLEAQTQSPSLIVTEATDGYHLLGWLGSSHPQDYTEWWYFNVYDSTNNVQAIFSYLINNPFNLSGGLAPLGISEMTAVAYTPEGIVPATFSKRMSPSGNRTPSPLLTTTRTRSKALPGTAKSSGTCSTSARRLPGTRPTASAWHPIHGN